MMVSDFKKLIWVCRQNCFVCIALLVCLIYEPSGIAYADHLFPRGIKRSPRFLDMSRLGRSGRLHKWGKILSNVGTRRWLWHTSRPNTLKNLFYPVLYVFRAILLDSARRVHLPILSLSFFYFFLLHSKSFSHEYHLSHGRLLHKCRGLQ